MASGRCESERWMNVRASRAFTLIELITVFVLIGLLAVSAGPALSTVQRSRESAAAREVSRLFVLARSEAMSTSEPTGVRVDPAAGTFEMLVVPNGTDPPAILTSPLGEPRETFVLGIDFPGIDVEAVVLGDGSTGGGTIWFGHRGTPQLRDGFGAYLGEFTTDASVKLTGTDPIYIMRGSGLVER